MDDALKTLFLPYERNLIPAPGAGSRVLFINARHSGPWPVGGNIQACQPFYPHARILEQNGTPVFPDMPKEKTAFDHVWILGSKNHAETQGFFAAGLDALKYGGWLLAAAGNQEGGSRLAKDAAALNLEHKNLSKHHARVIYGQKTGEENIAVVKDWLAAAAPQPIANGPFISQPGLFCWDRIDAGSQLLAAHIPCDLSGAGADFGCGFGYLAAHVLQHNPAIKTMTCIDADARAVECCRRNLGAIKTAAKIHCLWADLTAPLTAQKPFAWIVMNPPFHDGKTAQTGIGQSFIRTAASALEPGGRLYVVANAHLPYERDLSTSFSSVKKLAEQNGFKVYEART